MIPIALATAILAPTFAPSLPLTFSDDFFPRPDQPLILEVAADGESLHVKDLLDVYADLTDQQIHFNVDTRNLLEQIPFVLTRDLEVPIEEVQHYVELVLLENSFTLQILKSEGVRVLRVSSLMSAARNNLRSGAIFIPEDSLDIAAAHPAMLFMTVVSMPHCDTRQISNSMRTMITDANVQQMLPAGSESAIVLVGLGEFLWNHAKALHAIEDLAAERAEDLEPKLEIIALQNGDAPAMAALLTGLMRLDQKEADGAQVMADVRTNSLVISAGSQTMAKIKGTIAALDQ